MRKGLLIVTALALVLAAGTTVQADDKAEAKRHFEAGLSLLKAENYEGAALSFEASLELHPTMSGFFNLANCFKALERYDEALAALFRLRRDFAGRLSDEMRAETEAIEKEIKNLVGSLRVEVDRPGAKVLIDGREVGTSPLTTPVLLSPGNHDVTARLEGVEFGVERVRMLAGREITIDLIGQDTQAHEGGSTPSTPSTPSTGSTDSPPSGKRPSALFWGTAGGAVVTGVLSGVFFGLRGKAQGEFDDALSQWNALPLEGQASSAGSGLLGEMTDAAGDYDRFNGAGIGMVVAAGALTAAAVVILVVDMKSGEEAPAESASRPRLRPAPGGLEIVF